MPRDTQGNYSLPNGYRAVTGQKVLASQHNPPLEDLASNMTGSVARNGTSPMLADMPMGGHKITDMADGVANNDGATVGQVPAAVASVSPSLVAKDVPDDADLLVISDSADSNKPKKLSWEKLRTALQRIVSSAAGTLFTLESTATSVNSGPNIDLYRNSASPGVDNALAALLFNGQDSAGNKELYAAIRSILKSPTDGSEAAELILRTIVSGALADRLHIGAGAYMDGAAGGDPGIGKINAKGYQVNGKALWGSPDALLQDQKPSGTNGGSYTNGTWQKRDINTTIFDRGPYLTLAANEFTPSVDGYVRWNVYCGGLNQSRSRLYCVTDAAAVASSLNIFSNDGPGMGLNNSGGGPVVAGKTYRIEQRGSKSKADGLGYPNSFGDPEVYLSLEFWRAG